MNPLAPGHRVFVNIPKNGYVGVGRVTAPVVPAKDFFVEKDGERVSILNAPLEATGMGHHQGDKELQEYLVGVEWIKTLPKDKAVWETGLFASQHTACKLRRRSTIDRLTTIFKLDAGALGDQSAE